MLRLPLVLLPLLLAAPVTNESRAQLPPDLSPEARVSLVTVTPGDAVYSLFGHSALRFEDPQTGLDIAFNYGTFDFSAPWFIPKFVYGILEYQLSFSSMRSLLIGSQIEERGVVTHVLRLTPSEVDSLYASLLVNLRPENKTYRYDFFFDNCSTRIRDVIERAVPTRWSGEPGDGQTLRTLLHPYIDGSPWLHVGIDLIMGAVTDRPATAREAVFLPMILDEAFLSATVESPGLEPASLVTGTDTLIWYPEREQPKAAFPWPTLAGWLLLAVGAWATFRPGKPARLPGRADRALFGVVGFVGLVVVFLTFFSQHAAMAWNMNVVWALPTYLVFAVTAPRLDRQRFAMYLVLSAALGCATITAGFVLPQQVPGPLVPVALLLAARCLAGAFYLRSGEAS